MAWPQVYDPLHNWIVSSLVAALPILVLFGLLAGLRVKPHWGAIAGAGTAVLVAVLVFGMPLRLLLVCPLVPGRRWPPPAPRAAPASLAHLPPAPPPPLPPPRPSLHP